MEPRAALSAFAIVAGLRRSPQTPAIPLGHMGKTAAFNRFKTAMLGVAPGTK